MGGRGHRLHAPGHDDVGVTGGDHQVGLVDGVEARQAHLVDHRGGRRAGDAGPSGAWRAGTWPVPASEHLAHDHVVDVGGGDPGPLEGGGDGTPPELGGGEASRGPPTACRWACGRRRRSPIRAWSSWCGARGGKSSLSYGRPPLVRAVLRRARPRTGIVRDGLASTSCSLGQEAPRTRGTNSSGRSKATAWLDPGPVNVSIRAPGMASATAWPRHGGVSRSCSPAITRVEAVIDSSRPRGVVGEVGVPLRRGRLDLDLGLGEGGQRLGHERLERLGVDQFGGEGQADGRQRLGHVPAVPRAPQPGQDGPLEGVHVLPRGVQDQAADPFGMGDGQLLGRRRAEGPPEHVGPVDAEGVEEGDGVGGQARPWRSRRCRASSPPCPGGRSR